jgi:signal peptidase II
LSKLWIIGRPDLPLGSYWPYGGMEIIPGFFYIAHVGNRGAAWGLFAGYGFWLGLLAIGALVAIYYFRNELALRRLYMQVAFGLLCGGILGNLVDRMLRGHVVDFLDFHLPGYRWPAFNLADSGICIGITGYVIFNFSEIWSESRKKQPPDSSS